MRVKKVPELHDALIIFQGMERTLTAALLFHQAKQDEVAVHITPEDSSESLEASSLEIKSIETESITELQNVQQEAGPR